MRALAWMAPCFFLAMPLLPAQQPVIQNCDDGTEVDGAYWYEDGFEGKKDRLGRDFEKCFNAGFRFRLDNLEQGQEIVFARLRFPAFEGAFASSVKLLVEGVLQESAAAFSPDSRPSQKGPKTVRYVRWDIHDKWLAGSLEVPLWYSSPDLAPLVNEILKLPAWGTGPEGKTLILTVSDRGSDPGQANFVRFSDYSLASLFQSSPVVLEIYPTVYDTFLGKELLGRVTDRSATVKLHSLIDTDLYIEYGTRPEFPDQRTRPLKHQPGGQPAEIVLSDLMPNQRYYYRLVFRRAGAGSMEHGEIRTFMTQRARGETFSFAVQSDEHLEKQLAFPPDPESQALYLLTIKNMGDRSPNFFVSLGDFATTEFIKGQDARTLEEAKERYLHQRRCIDRIGHSAAFYLVLGNHEGEQGWYNHRGDQTNVNLALLSAGARKATIPNPSPDGFYSGNIDAATGLGWIEDYYSWTWGDALFVALDPFRYTQDESCKTEDGWGWTLGRDQYDWLFETLHDSQARWKFLFIHHLTTTIINLDASIPYYCRGGIEAVKYKVDGRPSFEWGGEEADGTVVFSAKRPGWNHGPVHDMLVAEGVDIVFHGHDHLFAWQELDGIVYLECPQPIATGTYGHVVKGAYVNGDLLPNSGHVHVTVAPDSVTVEYVRSYLPGAGVNGEIAFSRVID